MRVLLLLAAALAGFAQTPGIQILVASPSSRDPDFAQSVILLLPSGGGGAIGLILNRPATGVRLDAIPGLKSARGLVYDGGPVRIGLNALVRSRVAPQAGAEKLFGDVYLLYDKEAQRRFAISGTPRTFRIYIGQCGWSAAQLRDERRRGLWREVKPDASILFDAAPATLWKRLLNSGETR